MYILITGGSGFIGRHLEGCLKERGHSVTSISLRECDLTKAGTLEKSYHLQYDLIYHLAAWTQAGDFCLRYGGDQWVINQQINTNVLEWWQKRQPRAKLVALGTSVSYSTEDDLTEEKFMIGIPSEKFYAYAMSKRMLYAGLISLEKQYGLKYLFLVPSTIYGPFYHTDGRQMHFIFDLIRKIMNGKLHGEPVVLWGDGYQCRELVFINDFVEIMLQLTTICENDIVNIGAGEEFTIRHFAQLICNIAGYDFDTIQFDTTQYVGAKSKCLAINKLQSLLPGLKLITLEDGLSETIQWFNKELNRV